jgi:aromatic-L-amino-acid decarboxylase
MVPEKLEQAIDDDRAQGVFPLWVAATLGTTGSTAVDPLRKIGEICSRHGIWLHVDAALAGTALILPEMRWMSDGIEYADSLVFNPHKWMFTNFDCSVYLVKNPEALVRTFEISPEYLKTPVDERVNNYRDWGIQLGRRFRALKLWFVIRHFGVEGLREKLRFHIRLAHEFAEWIQASGDFETLAPVPLNTVCFRYKPNGVSDADELDRLNQALLMRLNRTGKVFMSHTRLQGIYALRLVVGQIRTERRHVEQAWELIRQTARSMDQ